MATLLQRLDARDRALFVRWALQYAEPSAARTCWIALTHLGSAWFSIPLALVPLVVGAPFDSAGAVPLILLVASHLVTQGVKRGIARRRPSQSLAHVSLVPEPDRFSFPSGHSAAAMSLAMGFVEAFPELAAPLISIAMLAGSSRVLLGVHYPGDVLAGQFIAIVTAIVVVGVVR